MAPLILASASRVLPWRIQLGRHAEPRPQRAQLGHEDARGAEDHREGDEALQRRQRQAWHGAMRREAQRCRRRLGRIAPAPRLLAEIGGIGEEEGGPQPGLEREGHDAENELRHEDDEEPALVVAEMPVIHIEPAAVAKAPAAEEQGPADDGIGDGAEHERPAECRADADVLLGGAIAEGDGDEGDDALGQGGAEGREDGARRLLREIEPVPHPLDAVHEELAGGIDRRGRKQQEDEGRKDGGHGRGPGLDGDAPVARRSPPNPQAERRCQWSRHAVEAPRAMAIIVSDHRQAC